MKYTLQQKYTIVTNMENYGGSFVKALSVAMKKADEYNFEKIANAFPEFIDEYMNLETDKVDN